jgi:hypothetical protein
MCPAGQLLDLLVHHGFAACLPRPRGPIPILRETIPRESTQDYNRVVFDSGQQCVGGAGPECKACLPRDNPAGVTRSQEEDVAPIVFTIEAARSPGEVFAYLTDPSRFGEWQEGVVSGRMEQDRPPTTVDSRFTTTRIGGAE